ncbi:hypothetical protein L0663_05295 [Dyadobacter sp. CY107]|uniref:hypothetical protein n=1 Tax=Dyadobacter fanqingshengii TaxID=2906443 RepID=UPI001F360137|nr:hypothetical protein [Dyadobacter fanqingshengii]MCF2502782.1 hypothetical protein [Dyadobacter fanqingshengii]
MVWFAIFIAYFISIPHRAEKLGKGWLVLKFGAVAGLVVKTLVLVSEIGGKVDQGVGGGFLNSGNPYLA